ncbi:hypothetical protein GQ600_3383 [Phytophthora cactorum]|nr:hypothetical protein GQ600_3383 [Phytophthora cactorum]
MTEVCILLLWWYMSHNLREEDAFLESLHRRLPREILCYEWDHMVRMRHYITLNCLKNAEQASWMDTWERSTDKNFLTTTSLTRDSFCRIFESIKLFYAIPTYHQALGLLLAFYVGSMQKASLSKEFGIPPSTLARALNAAVDALAGALRGFSPARILCQA